jgi:hypothetical protein
MRRALFGLALMICTACRGKAPSSAGSYLFVWAGDSAQTASDFLAVIDANPASAKYGSILTSVPTGVAATHPHHTEAEMPANGHLLANGFAAGGTWLFDLTSPLDPKIVKSFGEVAGFSHPHTYVRLADGNVLATFQYDATSSVPVPVHTMNGAPMTATNDTTTAVTGGLVEMDEQGTVIRRGSAVDPTISDRFIYPYSALVVPTLDRVVSTTTDMNEGNKKNTATWVQFWRFSDLKLMKSISLKPGPRGNENQFTGEPRLLPDQKSVYIHTFNCGLYLIRGVDSAEPTSTFVRNFPGDGCGVPLLVGHFWLQPVPSTHSLVSLDIADPEHPRDVSAVSVGDDEKPHWIAIDPTGRRVVLNSAGNGTGDRLFVINFDPATGMLSLDDRFRDAGATRAGVKLSGRAWPHGFTGTAIPHGTVFSR